MIYGDTGIAGAVDSLLITVLVFFFSLLIKRDLAFRLLLFMLLLSAASFISRFSAIQSLIRTVDVIVYSIPVIMAIIFQSDLKRALLSFGKRAVPATEQDVDITATDEIMKGLTELAARKIGALIVVSRQQPIEHLIQVGTDIDAKVTSELLNSIFLPYSPIHDGAVIIQHGKITMAGCLLPLSHNPDIAKSFGTRHRAALGLSEQADALVLVVSEETGKISAVHDGRINYDIDPAELKKNIRRAIENRKH